MATVRIQVNGRFYEIACDDGQEEHLRLLADEVNERVQALVRGAGVNPGEVMSLLLTALTMADELLENNKISGNQKIKSAAVINDEEKRKAERRIAEMEASMASTLDDIAQRIETIARQIEIG